MQKTDFWRFNPSPPFTKYFWSITPGALSLKNAINANAANALTLNLAWYR